MDALDVCTEAEGVAFSFHTASGASELASK
jgi:hypothetical protein